jgi:hypothetical protein
MAAGLCTITRKSSALLWSLKLIGQTAAVSFYDQVLHSSILLKLIPVLASTSCASKLAYAYLDFSIA